MNAYAMRNSLELRNYNTTITRAEFEAHFTKTRESIRFTFNGWDGKSYDGESRTSGIRRGEADQGRQGPSLHRRREADHREGNRREAPRSRLAGGC